MKVRSVNCLLQYIKLTLTALAPQLFRDFVVRSFCVSRFTVNKKELKKAYKRDDGDQAGAAGLILSC